MSALKSIQQTLKDYDETLREGGYAYERLRDAQSALEAAQEEYTSATEYFEEKTNTRDEWLRVLEVVEEYGYLKTDEAPAPQEPEEPEDEPEDTGLYGLQCRCIECASARDKKKTIEHPGDWI